MSLQYSDARLANTSSPPKARLHIFLSLELPKTRTEGISGIDFHFLSLLNETHKLYHYHGRISAPPCGNGARAMCLNRLDLLDGQKIKANNRRASGLVPYPRIGRNSEMVNFARSDRAAGLLHYPRVGRSDLPISNVNFNGDMEPDQFYNEHDAGLDLPVDLDYEGAAWLHSELRPSVRNRLPILILTQCIPSGFIGRAMKPKHAEKTLKDPSWLIPNRLHLLKDYRPSQKIDDSRSLYSNARGTSKNITYRMLMYPLLRWGNSILRAELLTLGNVSHPSRISNAEAFFGKPMACLCENLSRRYVIRAQKRRRVSRMLC